jgi:hypothetical protein
MWRIRQIKLIKYTLENASILRLYLSILLGSEQLKIITTKKTNRTFQIDKNSI